MCGAVALGVTFTLTLAAPGLADTVATCTTDSATTYCEQLPSGLDASAATAALGGVGMAEVALGVVLAFSVVVYLAHRAAHLATDA